MVVTGVTDIRGSWIVTGVKASKGSMICTVAWLLKSGREIGCRINNNYVDPWMQFLSFSG